MQKVSPHTHTHTHTSESVYRRRTYNTMAKRKTIKGQKTTIYKEYT
jgi:hypothetical protein